MYWEWLQRAQDSELTAAERRERKRHREEEAAIRPGIKEILDSLVGRKVRLKIGVQAMDGHKYMKGTVFTVEARYLDRVITSVRAEKKAYGPTRLVLKPEILTVVG